VKPFNFMSAFSVSKAGFAAAIASGKIGSDLIEDGLPSAVAPYDDDPNRSATKCFDRNTRKPVPASILKTYREAIADYAWHPESKFENAERNNSGITRRRHIEAVAVEYIGKEANRLEEQFFLGEMPEAQIEYGRHPDSRRQLLTIIRQSANRYGMEVLADAAGISRQQLHSILSMGGIPKRDTALRLCGAIARLRDEISQAA
jgi:DNA-binding phage protein